MPTADKITTTKSSGFIWLPPDRSRPKWKVEIEGEDITSDCIDGYIRKDVGALDFFNISLLNGSKNNIGKYNNKWSGGENVSIYMDYDNPPTTKVFQGKLESGRRSLSKMNGATFQISGRAFPEFADDDTRTITIDDVLGHEAILTVINDLNIVYGRTVITADLVENNGHIQKTTTKISRILTGTHIQMITIICIRLGYRFYVDTNGELFCFPIGNVKNDDEFITEGINLISINRFGFDSTVIKNEIAVVGQETENCLIVWTEFDISNQTVFWKKAKKIADNTVSTREQAFSTAKVFLEEGLLYTNNGSLICEGLPTLQPGQSFLISSRYCGISGYVEAESLVFRFSKTGGFLTDVTVNQHTKSLGNVFKLETEERKRLEMVKNPNNMKYSYHFTFSAETNLKNNISELSGLIVSEGALKLLSGFDTGTMISLPLTLPETVTKVEVRMSGEKIDDTIVKVKMDRAIEQTILGTTFDGSPATQNTLDTPGTNMVIYIQLKGVESWSYLFMRLESLVVLARP